MAGSPDYASQSPIGSPDRAALPETVGFEASPPPTPAKPMARLRLNTVGDVAKELRKIYREARAGTLATSEASKLAFLLNMLANITAATQLEDRVAMLENAKQGR